MVFNIFFNSNMCGIENSSSLYGTMLNLGGVKKTKLRNYIYTSNIIIDLLIFLFPMAKSINGNVFFNSTIFGKGRFEPLISWSKVDISYR